MVAGLTWLPTSSSSNFLLKPPVNVGEKVCSVCEARVLSPARSVWSAVAALAGFGRRQFLDAISRNF